MKSLTTLLTQTLADAGDICAIDTSKDLKTILTRFDDEGLSFLAVTLPALGRGLERGLDLGRATPNLFPGFRTRQNLPVLLGGFFELVFERSSGVVLEAPSIGAISMIRQITLMFKKIEVECSPEAIQGALDSYVQCDAEVRDWETSVDETLLLRFQRMSSLIFSRVFMSVDREIRDYKIQPSHGPGATADRRVANAKFEVLEWTERLEAVFPFWRYATTSRYSQDRYDRVHFREPDAERPVKVVHVPKTVDKPRIIAEEPACMQYAQQGIARSLKRFIDSSYLESMIGTEHQEPNQLLALRGSIDGSLATLDLSEASDRVSNLLVMKMTEHWPHLFDGIQACRSMTADVEGHGVIPLARFASMGSALTFPVETMVFLTIVMIGLEDAYHTHFSRTEQIAAYSGSVRIYGDDIVVPVEAVDHVILALESYGFKVNHHKSFWNGQFRESCGKEYYAGEDVTLARVTHLLPSSRGDVTEMISAVAFRNNVHARLLWNTSRWMDDYISSMIPFPAVSETSPVLGAVSPFTALPEYRLHPAYHVPVVKGMVPRYRRRYSPIDGEAALMKTLGFYVEDDPMTGRPSALPPREWWNPVVTEGNHLQYSGRPEAAALNFRMARA